MKLYYAPGACSMGIHVLLEEIGNPFELAKLSLQSGEQQKPPFIELNPKGKVPTLVRDDRSVLTEYPVIAHFLAESYPEAGMLPDDEEAQLRAAEATDYCVATIHMQGFSRLFRPSNFAPSESDHEAVKVRGRELAEKGFTIMGKALGDKPYLEGKFSFADSALFYVAVWATKHNVTVPANIAAHRERMLARPAVQRMMQSEGLTA